MSNPAEFTPRQRFLTSRNAEGHLKWSRSEDSRAAIEAVLSHMAITCKGPDLILLQGASEMAKLLLDLAEPKTTPQRMDRSSLGNAPTKKEPT